ncbi:hypothetical protein [Streptomyces caeruleatus]|uniref:Uncharacterized protein n=1 Tax=Streptomyces caeruleatus TaxID=661399 RepID=A0A117RS00_9ACTN|nr:hypothetical protein [Streptomyces caeruleatus]KUO06036.1 hypothetical protein AQJ67_04360 [Streptomyces caeruleatus]
MREAQGGHVEFGVQDDWASGLQRYGRLVSDETAGLAAQCPQDRGAVVLGGDVQVAGVASWRRGT